MNLTESTKKNIFKILESPYSSDLDKISLSELDQIEEVFSFGRCEFLLKTSNLLRNFPLQKKKKLENFIELREINSLKIFSEFIKLGQVLNSKKIKYIPLKGLQMNLLTYKNLHLRPIRDIDLLISKESLTPFLECMFSIGYKFKNSDTGPSEFKYSDYRYDIPVLINKKGVHVETHLRVIDERFNEMIFEKSYEKKYSDNLSFNFMSNEDLIIHLIYHATVKNGFDNGVVSIFDVVSILRNNKISYFDLINRADTLGLKKNVCCFLSMLNLRFAGLKIEQNFLIAENNLNLKNYEDLILLNYADKFSFRLFNNKKISKAFSRNAFLSESQGSKVGLKNLFGRIFRVAASFLKTIFSISMNKRFRVDVKRVHEINRYLDEK